MKDDEPNPLNENKSKKKPKNGSKITKRINFRWALTILGWSFVLSVIFTVVSDTALKGVGYFAAFLILGAFILLGIVFDILGIATASASEKPFHAMASRRVDGSREALWLIKNVDKVSSFCNDVVGDIAGIISGSTAAVIIARFNSDSIFYSLILTGAVAGLTVGGKALGKGLAISFSNEIVFFAGRIINIFKKKT